MSITACPTFSIATMATERSRTSASRQGSPAPMAKGSTLSSETMTTTAGPIFFVGNDSVPNFLFHNKGKGVFEGVGLIAGVAVGNDGQPLAGMGVDMGDIDGDGLLDIIVTNLDRQT